jgi:hypothetical protein
MKYKISNLRKAHNVNLCSTSEKLIPKHLFIKKNRL